MSMVGMKLLHLIDRRCRDIFPNIDESFAGIHAYMFGDFRQLPPVKDFPLYSKDLVDPWAVNVSLVFQTLQKVVELSVCHRQKTDIETGEVPDKDFNLLSRRRLSILDSAEQDEFRNAIYIFSTNDAVEKK